MRKRTTAPGILQIVGIALAPTSPIVILECIAGFCVVAALYSHSLPSMLTLGDELAGAVAAVSMI